MHFDYGYIRGTRGTDGDAVDVYLGPDERAPNVYVVNQMRAPAFKVFDEQKCMLGFPNAKAAKAAYIRQYDNPRFFGNMLSMSFNDFARQVTSKETHGQPLKKMSELEDRIDDAGIGLLAAPYAAELAGMGLKGWSKTRRAGEILENWGDKQHKNTSGKIRELVGLTMVASGVSKGLGKQLDKQFEKEKQADLGGTQALTGIGKILRGGTRVARPAAAAAKRGLGTAATEVQGLLRPAAGKTFAGAGVGQAGPAIGAASGKTLSGMGPSGRVAAPGMEAEHAAWKQRGIDAGKRNASMNIPGPVARPGGTQAMPLSGPSPGQHPLPRPQTQVGGPPPRPNGSGAPIIRPVAPGSTQFSPAILQGRVPGAINQTMVGPRPQPLPAAGVRQAAPPVTAPGTPLTPGSKGGPPPTQPPVTKPQGRSGLLRAGLGIAGLGVGGLALGGMYGATKSVGGLLQPHEAGQMYPVAPGMAPLGN